MEKRMCSVEGCGSGVLARGWCTKHYTRWQRHGDPLVIRRLPNVEPGATEKRCPRCGETKPLAEFGSRGGDGSGGTKGYCWPCEKAYLRERNNGVGNAKRRAVSRNSRRRNHWKVIERMYGFTQADYDAMLERQGGRCAICSADKVGGNGTRWHIDHDHTTGLVRGLLCMKCNLGLGYFDDDHRRLINACLYLGAVPSSPLGFFQEVS